MPRWPSPAQLQDFFDLQQLRVQRKGETVVRRFLARRQALLAANVDRGGEIALTIRGSVGSDARSEGDE